MVNYTNSNAFLLAGIESTYNTPVTANKYLGIASSIDAELNNNLINIRNIGNREVDDYIAGNFSASVSLSGTLNSGALFELFFGQATDTLSGSDYVHTFIDTAGSEAVKSDISSFTLSENYDGSSDIVYTYSGCVLNTLEVSVNVGEKIETSAEILAASATTSTTAGTKVTSTTKPLVFSNATLSTGTAGSESVVAQVSSFSISLNNNFDLEDIRGIGSRFAQGAIPKDLEIEGEFTVKFNSLTEANLFLGGTSPTNPTPIGLIFNANNGVALGSGRVELDINLSNVLYESIARSVGENAVVEETFSFKAGKIDSIKFVDAVASYF
jgi:hypothetical protein